MRLLNGLMDLLQPINKTLPDKNGKLFYDNVIGFAKNKTYNRGEMMGVDKGKRGYLSRNKEGIRTNIIGYMDGFSATQKIIMKRKGIASPMTIRESRFIIDYPDKWSKAQPLIRDIDKKYKSLNLNTSEITYPWPSFAIMHRTVLQFSWRRVSTSVKNHIV